MRSPHLAHNLRRGRGTRRAGPAGHDVRNIDGRIDEQRRRQGLRQHTRRGHDTDLPHARTRGVTRTRVDDVMVQQARGPARNIRVGSPMGITRYIGAARRISVRVPRASHMSVRRHKAEIQRCTTTSGLIRMAFVARRCGTLTRCFTQCFTRAKIGHTPRHTPHERLRHRPGRMPQHGLRHRPGTNRTSITQRPKVVAGRRQGRHAARRQFHDAGN